MARSPDGVFCPWDPGRPYKGRICARPGCSEHSGSCKSMMRCGRCHIAHYCSKDCQRKHWAAHKPLCQGGLAEYWKSIERHVSALRRLRGGGVAPLPGARQVNLV